jgi:hypothetical protein
MAKKKARGPRGGVKHQPVRGHDRRSAAQRKKEFARKALRLREQERQAIEQQWAIWDKLNEEQRRLLPDLRPRGPRPTHDRES